MKTVNIAILLILTVSLFSACKKSSENKSTITAEYYFKGTLNGQALTWQAGVNGGAGFFTGTSGALARDQGVTTGELTALLSPTAGDSPQFGVGFRTFKVNFDQNITAYFDSFVNTGAWTYAVNDDHTAGVKAIAIYYTDAQGKTYSSVHAQTGSTANVIAVTPEPAQAGSNEGVKIKLTFSCTLYPTDGTGAALPLTNAEATVLLEDLLDT